GTSIALNTKEQNNRWAKTANPKGSLLVVISPTMEKNRMNRKLRALMSLAAVTLALVWCIPSVGQVIRGSISGTVTDPSGAVVSSAQVKAKNVETGSVFTTTSDSSGLFRLNLLQVGT